MSFRELVLEHYIDCARATYRDVFRSQKFRLRFDWLKNSDRTPKKVRAEAQQIAQEAIRLRSFIARPFSRVFAESASDLDEAAKLLQQAASERKAEMIVQAQQQIGQVYRAMKLMDLHWYLEELLFQVAILQEHKAIAVSFQQQHWHQELQSIYRQFTTIEPLTGKHLEHGFTRPVLEQVVPHVQLADQFLMQNPLDLCEVRKELKAACEPF